MILSSHCRCSEYRAALAAREAHGGTPLTRADFQSVYAEEAQQGKFWGVEHDLRVLRGRVLQTRHETTRPEFYVLKGDHLPRYRRCPCL